jgi:hypothetical protein
MASILSPHCLYGGNRKAKLTYYIILGYTPPKGTLGNLVITPSDRCASTVSLRSTNATLPIMSRVFHFEVSGNIRRTPTTRNYLIRDTINLSRIIENSSQISVRDVLNFRGGGVSSKTSWSVMYLDHHEVA